MYCSATIYGEYLILITTTVRTILLLLLGAGSIGGVHAATVENVRLWVAPDHTRLVFDTSNTITHHVFTLLDPHRIVIDIKHARLDKDLAKLDLKGSVISRIRTGLRKRDDLRVVLDLRAAAEPNSFILGPYGDYGHRLVLDILHKPFAKPNPKKDSLKARPRSAPRVPPTANKLIIVIDAGHGGEDYGAKGKLGTKEKEIVLAIARRLKWHIDQTAAMRAIMTRTGDYYLSLRRRIHIARQHRADLFISIHADSGRSRYAKGGSVYTLSGKGASDEATRWLAEKENAADLIGGVNISRIDELTAFVILNLSQTAAKQTSLDVAQRILLAMRKIGKVHSKVVKQAGFVVLKALDIPSVLVETAFISNPKEERKLRNKKYQDKLAKAMLAGIITYYVKRPRDTMVKRHVISHGETLSTIAEHYAVSLRALRRTNGLKGDRVMTGQVLRIPTAGVGRQRDRI